MLLINCLYEFINSNTHVQREKSFVILFSVQILKHSAIGGLTLIKQQNINIIPFKK